MAFKAGNIGAEISVQGLKNAPANAAGTINGPWVAVADAIAGGGNFASAKAFGNLANCSGSPTAATLTLKIEDATDSSGTGEADYKADGSNVCESTTGISEGSPATSTDDTCELQVDLRNARAFVRVVGTLTLTGGTTPKADIVLGFVLGGPTNTPLATQNA